MALGKKELTAAVVVGIVVVAAAVHFGIFQQKAQRYAQVSQEYGAAVQILENAEFIRDEESFTNYQNLTTQYKTVADNSVAQLNLQTLDIGTPPHVGAIDVWASSTIALLSELNQRRAGAVRLSFLDQNGWNIPSQLPGNPGAAALTDRMSRLINAYRALQASQQPVAQSTARLAYNRELESLGIPARETSFFVYPNYMQPQLYFNSQDWITNFLDSSNQRGGGAQRLPGGGYDLRNFHNIMGLQRFGQAVPALKKIWVYALIRQTMGGNVDAGIMNQFGEALEVGIPIDSTEPLNSINKQLRALIDIADAAQRHQVQEIQKVVLMRPINIERATIRQPGATPPPEVTPEATPDMMMGGMGMGMMMDMGMPAGGMMGQQGSQPTPVPDAEAVGTGAGIEMEMLSSNSSLVRFYYELSHKTATYGLDDLYVYQSQNGLLTTATIEVITDIKTQDGVMDAPAEDGAVF